MLLPSQWPVTSFPPYLSNFTSSCSFYLPPPPPQSLSSLTPFLPDRRTSGSSSPSFTLVRFWIDLQSAYDPSLSEPEPLLFVPLRQPFCPLLITWHSSLVKYLLELPAFVRDHARYSAYIVVVFLVLPNLEPRRREATRTNQRKNQASAVRILLPASIPRYIDRLPLQPQSPRLHNND